MSAYITPVSFVVTEKIYMSLTLKNHTILGSCLRLFYQRKPANHSQFIISLEDEVLFTFSKVVRLANWFMIIVKMFISA